MNIKKLILPMVGLSVSAILISAGSAYFEISKNIDIFISLYKKVDELYVNEVDHSRIMRKGIDAMLAELDPYTVYYSESQVEDFKIQTTGSYSGIGARVGKHGEQLVITQIYEGSPAQESGLMPGDILIQIDGKDLEGKSVDDLGELLKGEENTKVTLKYSRQGEIASMEVKRAEIKVNNVSYAGMVADDIGYVKFDNFRMDAAKDVKEKMDELKKEGMEHFILDMRGNPGGLLKEAVDIVNLFVGQNQLVVSTKGKNPNHSRDYKTYRRPYDEDIRVVVLVDDRSASASEIVAASLQDYDRGVVIGRTSFGKGLVQITQMLTYNSQLKVTTSKYHTASGRCVQRLDYASRDEDGNVPEVPDSLITEFKTQAGRTVHDGAGVKPDIPVSQPFKSPLLRALINGHHIFNFAANYHYTHEEISSIKEFEVTDADLVQFKNYLAEVGFEYSSKTQRKLINLKNTLDGHPDSTVVTGKIDELNAYLESLKSDEFTRDKELIREYIRLEIVQMYYFKKGRAAAALSNDADLNKAIEVLSGDAYQRVLTP